MKTNIIEQLKEFQERTGKSWYRISRDLDLPTQTIYYWKYKGNRPIAIYEKMIKEYIERESVKDNN